MSRKGFPWKELDERKRYLRIYKRLAKGTPLDSMTEEDRKFYADVRARMEHAGVKMKDPSSSSAGPGPSFSSGTEAGASGPSPDRQAGSGTPSADSDPPKRPTKKQRPPLDIKIPPDKLAAAIMMGAKGIEIQNRAAGFPGMPDVWFPVAEQLLCDYLEELAARGWDLRKLRGVILGGGFAVTAVQGVRRKVAESKKKKTIVVDEPKQAAPSADSPPNGEHQQAAPKSVVEDELDPTKEPTKGESL